MRSLILAAVLLMPSEAGTQVHSDSMTDCASVYQNAAQWVKTDESADKMMFAAIMWAEAAVAQARVEGLNTTDEAIWRKIDGKTKKWEEKGETVFFSQEYRDWTQYCRNLSGVQNLSINP